LPGMHAVRWAAATVTLAAALAGLWWLQRERWPISETCPEGLQADPERGTRIVSLLGSTRAGRQLLEQADRPLAICFAELGAGRLRTDGWHVLPSQASDAENAARLAHLLHHQAHGPLLPERVAANVSCESLVAEALSEEAQAYTLELKLLRELGASGSGDLRQLAAAYWAAAPEDRARLVARHLRSSHFGASLAEQYAARCRHLPQSGK
jgi:hypothetical protein